MKGWCPKLFLREYHSIKWYHRSKIRISIYSKKELYKNQQNYYQFQKIKNEELYEKLNYGIV